MTPQLPIYLDHSATTPMDPRVFEAMRPYFTETFGNPASKSHSFGWAAERAVVRARNQVAALLGVEQDAQTGAREILFTAGATESNNLAIKGVADAYRDKGRHIVSQVTEHKSVLDTCKRLQRDGWEITWVGVDRLGRVSPADVEAAIRPDTVLVSVMYANNETGTVQPVREIGRACRGRGVLFHTDATQAVGKLPMIVDDDCIDLLSMTGHKMYGPKGTGALFVRRKNPRVRLTALIDGGGHERGFRSGTLNVPGIVALGAACEVVTQNMTEEARRLAALRDRLEAGIRRVEGVSVNGDPGRRLPFVTNLSFAGVDGSQLLRGLDDVAVSSGSACTSASLEASYVLRAMGTPDDLAYSSVRYSVGRFTTEEQVDYAAEKTVSLVRRLRSASAGAACGTCAPQPAHTDAVSGV
jgi:cysteine desulfurase